MSEEYDDAPDAEQNVEDHGEAEQVRRLLAAAGATDPASAAMPARVSARLDDVLADLAQQRAAGRRPRRSLWPRLAVAAAVISVVGIGVGAMTGVLTPDQLTTAGAPEAESAGGQAEEPNRAADGAAELQSQPAQSLRSSSVRADVQRIEDLGLAAPVAEGRSAFARACARPATGPGDEWLRVTLDGDPAILVLRAPADGRRTANVFTCGNADSPAATVRIDAR